MDKKVSVRLAGFIVSFLLLSVPYNEDFLNNVLVDTGQLTVHVLHAVKFFAFIFTIVFAIAIVSQAVKSLYSKE